MALETGTHINSLNASNPVSTDGLAQADDHIRLIKATIKASFPNITGAMTATHTVLNGLDGRITALEASLPAPSGTSMLFAQSAAPTGWTKQTTHNDKTLRIVSGTASSGGSVAFTTAFTSKTPAGSISSSVSGTTASHTLTTAQIPAHRHLLFSNNTATGTFGNSNLGNSNSPARQNNGLGEGDEKYSMMNGSADATVGRSQSIGGGAGHTHGAGSLAVSSTFTGTAINLAVQYVDVIIANKD